MKPVEFHPSARAELDAAVEYYEVRLEGLGLRFLAAVQEASERIESSPEAGSPLPGELRKRLVQGFPFSVIYGVSEHRISILAVAHQHRRPGYWRRRIGQP